MKFLLLALFLASASASSLIVGNIKCTFGPSYWCQNYKQAKECDAIKHCQENVWKVKASASNVTCEDCVSVVTFLKEVLTNPDFEKEIEGLIDEVCVKLGPLEAECKAIIEQYGPLIFQKLAEAMGDPKQDCTDLGLCTTSKEKILSTLLKRALPVKAAFKPKKHVLKSKYPVKTTNECVLCEFLTRMLDYMLWYNATEQDIIAALDKVCSILPSNMESKCTSFLSRYGPIILKILSQEMRPSLVCATVGACPSKEHIIAMMKPHKLKIGSPETCEICTLVMTYFKTLLKDNNTEIQVIDDLKKLCNYLPSQIASECNAIVSEYGKEILELIENADPKNICIEIGMCTANMTREEKIVKNNKCYLGASFWCANPVNAIKCNAVSFCKKHAS